MFRILQRRFGFSTYFTNYMVGEKVLGKLYHGDKELILSDAIIKELETLRGMDKIDDKILQKHIDAFIPNRGIQPQELGSGVQTRQTEAINSQRKFALSPHPIMMAKLMKLLYAFDDSKKLWLSINNSMIYLLGSRGLSKSTSFLILQYFHNLRIPYIMK